MKPFFVFLIHLVGLNCMQAQDFVFNYYVCEVDNCITLIPHLGDIEEELIECYAWESEDDISSPQQQQQEICPTEDTEYSLFIIDADGNIIEEIKYKVHVLMGEPPAAGPGDVVASDKSINEYSCNLANKINLYVSENDLYSTLVQEASLVFAEITEESSLEVGLFFELVDRVDVFLDTPESEDAIFLLIDFFTDNNINFFALDPRGIRDGAFSLCRRRSKPNPDGWSLFTRGNFYGQTRAAETALRNRYPISGQQERIDIFWPCRVFGPAQEEVALKCLNLPQRNTLPNGTGLAKRPDGYIERWASDFFNTYYLPFFIEVKGRFKNDVFSWGYDQQVSRLADQGVKYASYLSNPANTHLPTSSVRHGLYLIVPGGVAIDNAIVDYYSVRNIPLYCSVLEKFDGDQRKIRVSYPEFVNYNTLNNSSHVTLMKVLGKQFLKYAGEACLYAEFQYSEEYIDYSIWIDKFETSYLATAIDPSCSVTNCCIDDSNTCCDGDTVNSD